jgi:hypothetical protein
VNVLNCMKTRPLHTAGVLLIAATVVWNSAFGQVRINEVMADNGGAVTAPGGGSPDYIELINLSSFTTNISGWKLVDSTSSSDTNAYVFPANTFISAGGYLVVWLDAQTNVPLHATSFSLSANGEVISLFKSSTVADRVAFGIQVNDKSLCRMPNGTGTWVLGEPTPGITNARVTLGTQLALRLNEWLPTNSAGADKDRLEIFNPKTNGPVMLGGSNGVLITGKLTVPDTNTPFVFSNSFIASGGYVRFTCDSKAVDVGDQADHLDFKLSSSSGETISIYLSNRTTLVDQIKFGTFTNLPLLGRDISMGRVPDGGTNIVFFYTNNTTLGSANLEFEKITNIVVSEVLTHTDPPLEDAIELYNPTAATVDLGNWWLSNSQDNPEKFRILPGTTLAAGAYKVFYEQSIVNGPTNARGFNHTGTGETPYFTLNSAHGDNVVLTRFGPLALFGGSNAAFQLNHAFDAAPNGVSFGRYIKSDGGADLVAMPVRTFGVDNPSSVPNFRTGTGLPNVYPKVGPIVISEIMYHPPDNGPFGTNDNSIDEFIELTSVSGVTEPLYDPAYPTNTWSIDGAAKFTFPMGVTLSAGGRLLVVNFNPTTNTAQLTAFRALYGVPANTPIFGPLAGKLDNSSESVFLYKPDAVQLPPHDDAGYVPQVLVEKVKYEDVSPWPAEADGTGYSLQRLSLTGYSNDHTNWFAAPPTAGIGGASLVPVFALQALPNGSFKLVVVTTPGRSYMVEGSTSLAPNSWTAITNFTATSTNSPVTDNAVLNLLQFRFYRAKSL